MGVGNPRSGKILLVDDETAIIKMMVRLLEQLGHQVMAYSNGADALEWLKAHPDDFDLLITDIGLPDLMGDTFAKEAATINPDIPIIICTGYSECISDEEREHLGVKGVLEKPFKLLEMKEMLQRVLPEVQ